MAKITKCDRNVKIRKKIKNECKKDVKKKIGVEYEGWKRESIWPKKRIFWT